RPLRSRARDRAGGAVAGGAVAEGGAMLRDDTIIAVTFGCADPHCGYKTLPTTLGTTPYTACPVCGGPWITDPPKRIEKPATQKARRAARETIENQLTE